MAPAGLLLAALSVLLGSPAAAQAPPPPPPPQEAEPVWVTHERSETSLLEVRQPGAAEPLREERTLTTATRYRRARTPTGWTVRFESWRRAQGSREDTCLAGAELAFAEDPAGAKLPTWRLVAPPERELSRGAQRYLEGLARELHAPLAGDLLGSEPGQTRWKPALAPLAARLLPSGEVDLKASSGQGSREPDPDAKRARGRVELSLQTRRLPGTAAPITKEGVWQAKVELGWPGGRTPQAETTSWRLKASYAGEARDQRPDDGAMVALRATAELSERFVVTPAE